MSFRRVVVIATVCAMAWILSAIGRDSHADTPNAPVGPLLALTLLHSNDIHSHIESFIDTIPQGGVARSVRITCCCSMPVIFSRAPRSSILGAGRVDHGDERYAL